MKTKQKPKAELLEAIGKLLPHAESKQERLYKLALKYPGRHQSRYEDCRHAVSFAYQALARVDKGRRCSAKADLPCSAPGVYKRVDEVLGARAPKPRLMANCIASANAC